MLSLSTAQFTVRLCLALMAGLLASGCVTPGLSTEQVAAGDTEIETSIETSESESDSDNKEAPDQDLPKVDLSEELLVQLMSLSFAPYAGDFALSAEQAFKAAEISRDHRLASFSAVTGLRVRNYELALNAAQLWLELQPEESAAQTTLILAHLGNGNAEQAYTALQARDAALPLTEQVENGARILSGQDNEKVAMQVAQRITEDYPELPDAFLSAAFVADKFSQDEQATTWLKSALALKPGWDRAAQLKANVLRRQGKTEERAEFIRQFLEQNPESVMMRINHAAELAREEKFADALTLMQQVVKDDPRNVSALSYAAALAEHQQDKELAKGLYRRVLRLEPSNDEVNWTLARFAVQEKNYELAEEYYQNVVGDRYYFRAQLQVANMRYHTQGLKEAVNVLRVLEPRTEDEYIDRATTRHYLLMQEHQYEEAFAAINETLSYLPENLDLRYARSLVAAELGEIDTVEADLRYVIEQQPDNADALNALGYTLADQTERYEEARDLIAKALELSPKAAHILDSMGWVLYRLGDLEQAQTYLQEAYDEAPQAEIAAHLGEVLWERGLFDQARSVWRQGLSDDDENPVLLATLKRYGVDLDGELAVSPT